MWGMMEDGKIAERDQKQYKRRREILDIKHFFFLTQNTKGHQSPTSNTQTIFFKQIPFRLSLETSLKYVIV